MDQSVMASILRLKAAPARPAGDLGALRQAIRKIEGSGLEDVHGGVAFGVAGLDAALGGGLARGALHEIAATRESDMPAATGFSLALAFLAGSEARSEQADRAAKRPVTKRAVIWIAEDMALNESGLPYGPGLDAHGLPPERLITVTVAHSRDVLWAMEEALRSSAVGVVIGEVRGARLDLVATRRLTLAAAGHGALALMLRAAPDPEASAAATRWIVGAAPSVPLHGSHIYGPGPPRVHAQLVRNRRGHLGSWTLEWNADHERFTTHSQPVPAASVHRPARAAVA